MRYHIDFSSRPICCEVHEYYHIVIIVMEWTFARHSLSMIPFIEISNWLHSGSFWSCDRKGNQTSNTDIHLEVDCGNNTMTSTPNSMVWTMMRGEGFPSPRNRPLLIPPIIIIRNSCINNTQCTITSNIIIQTNKKLLQASPWLGTKILQKKSSHTTPFISPYFYHIVIP